MNEEKKKNNRKRRLILLFLLIAVTGILLSTTSYAWFTANETVTVNKITVNVAAQNGIQLSTDATSWKTIISTTDITTAHTAYVTPLNNTNQLPNSLEPVSTDGTIDTDGRLEMFYGTTGTNTVSGKSTLTAIKSTEARGSVGYFIMFDLFFKLDTDATTPQSIFLTANSGVTTSDVADKGIKNASRIAFITEGHVATGTALATIQDLFDASGDLYVWEPNFDVHTAAAVAAARDTYNITTTEAGGALLAYEGVTDVIAIADDVLLSSANSAASGCKLAGVTHSEYATQAECETATGTWTTAINDTFFNPVTVTYSTPALNAPSFQLFTLNKGITKVRVYMWVEGQDVDCENEASGGNIDFDLQFSLNQ